MNRKFDRALPIRMRIQDEFWSPILDRMYGVTLKDTLDKLEKDGVLRNYQRVIDDYERRGNGEIPREAPGGHEGNPWNDGLLMETVRGAAEYYRDHPNPEIVGRVDRIADIVERAQLISGGGYLSTYTMLERPMNRYGMNGGSILWQHDIYNQGALIEAGVAVYRAMGKRKLLECAIRAADAMCEEIGPAPKMAVVPGHSLTESCMIELYQLTGERKYLDLAEYWVRARGHHERRKNMPQYMGEYAQDHAPIESQFQAVGHAVRATLYYTGATMLAEVRNDEKLLSHCDRLFDSIVEKKLHITGGVGATAFEEKFGADYDLRNDAYLETCAAAGLIRFAEALGCACSDAKCADITERALYNAMLSSVSLEGNRYFYQNPLSSRGNDHRWEWHTCPCCPPMIHKTFSRMPEMILAGNGRELQVRQYVGGTAEYLGKKIRMESKFPWSGKVRLWVHGLPVKMRVPEWSTEPSFRVDGENVRPEIRDGWAIVKECDYIEADFGIRPRRICAHPYAEADRGREAVCLGPLVYCMEGVDNEKDADRLLGEDPSWKAEYDSEMLGGVMVLRGRDAQGRPIAATPQYAWDNRESGDMNVWMRCSKEDSRPMEFWAHRLYAEKTKL